MTGQKDYAEWKEHEELRGLLNTGWLHFNYSTMKRAESWVRKFTAAGGHAKIIPDKVVQTNGRTFTIYMVWYKYG